MNDIKYIQHFCGCTQDQARMAQDGRFFGAGIDTSADAIDTLARSERGEPTPLLAMLPVDPRKLAALPAKRHRGLPLIKEDKDADAPRRFAWKSCLGRSRITAWHMRTAWSRSTLTRGSGSC
jgi:hypothetical protein